MVGTVRKQSEWIDINNLLLDLLHKNALDGEEIELTSKGDHAIGDFIVCFTVIPHAVDKSILFSGLLPFSKANLKAKLDNIDKQLIDPLIPTLGLRIYKLTTKKVHFRPHPIPLLQRKGRDQGFGLGHLPFLEVIRKGAPLFPAHNNLEQSLANFLWPALPTNNLSNKTKLASALRDTNFPNKAPASLSIVWPEYKVPSSRATPPALPKVGEHNPIEHCD